jgi:hypothetical protein
MPIDRGYASAKINVYVWSGLCAPDEIERIVLRSCFEPEDITEADATWVSEEIARAWSAQLEEEKSWPATTSWDRLNAAFADLNAGGIIALHDAGMTLSDGMTCIAEEHHARGAEKSGVVGYCFYHFQDIEIAIMGSISLFWETWPTRNSMRRRNTLALAFGGIDDVRRTPPTAQDMVPQERGRQHVYKVPGQDRDPQKGVEIGRRVATAVEQAGLPTSWDGTIGSRIIVDMYWQKRYHRYRAMLAKKGSDPSPSWDDFTVDLGRDLAGMRRGETRIFSCGTRYVQLGAVYLPPFTCLETVSNMYLPPDQSLTPDEEQTLRRLGWGEPESPGPSNWRLEYPWPLNTSQAAEAAQLLTDTIRAVLRTPSPGDLQTKAF